SLLILFFLPRTPPLSPLFPYTTLFRSPDLGGCSWVLAGNRSGAQRDNSAWVKAPLCLLRSLCSQTYCNRKKGVWRRLRRAWKQADRKSTRLNSSHLVISYAVFCLKKKK